MEKLAKLWTQLQDNLLFVLVSLVIVVVLTLAAKLAERFIPSIKQSVRGVSKTRWLCITAICSAIATVLYTLDFPLPFLAPEFYKLDFSEVPVLLCGFYLGPTAAVACEAVKVILKILFKGTTTAFVGDLANFVVGCSLVLPATIIYHIRKRIGSAIGGLILGSVILTIFGSLFNAVYLLPKFSQLYGLPLDAIIGMGAKINPRITSLTSFVMLAVAPLNLIKGFAVSLLTLLLYKRVARPLFGIRT